MTTADRIREARVAAGFSQADLAELLCCQRQRINNVESGRSEPSLEWLYDLAVALKVPPERLDPRLTAKLAPS